MGDEEAPAGPVPKKVLFVLTSVGEYPDGSPTGFYLQEVTHPYFKFTEAGWECAFASVGGTSPCDPSSVTDAASDPETMAFWEDEAKKALLTESTKLADLPVEEAVATYDAIYFVGGYGVMWDFPECAEAQELIKAAYEAGKVVAAVCHAPIAFVNVTLSDETKLLAGKECTAFTNAEDAKMGKTEAVAEGSGPGSCEDAMMKAGGIFKDGGVFGENVVVSGNLMTGQNPPSAGPLATAVIYFYDKILAEFEPPRKALLAERAELAAAVMKTKADFEGELTALKKKEGTVDVAAKIETLQLKTTAGHEYLMGCIANIDGALERLAIARKAAVDAAAAAAAADAEE